MDSAAYQNPYITMNNNVGNVVDSFNVWNSFNCETPIPDKKRQILEWLSPLAPRERHQAVREGRVDGVGDWLLRTSEFEKWHTSEGQTVNPVLFCYGDPGVGKTYMSSLAIDTLCDAIGGDNVAVACAYCDFHAYKAQSATSVLAVLLKQLVAGLEPVPGEIKEAFEHAKKKVDGRALRLTEIRTMLAKSLSSLRRGFICIDALDEFPTKHRPELWDSLQYIVRDCPNARLFVTGRPHIREEVKKHFPGQHNIIPISPTEEDIGGYLAHRLKNDPDQDGAMDTELEVDILGIIPGRISGSFLLVSLVMDAVLGEATIHQRRQTLHKMTSGFGLDDAYSTTLSRIREQKGGRAKLGMDALMWISRSARPLKEVELCHALAVEVGTMDLNVHNVPPIKTLLSCTLGLITIDKEAPIVRLVHFTLQEYLAAHPNLFITPHSMMAEICLTYLNFLSVCELATTLDTIPPTMPFLHYAACYWGFHAKKEMTERAKHLALRLLERDANHISVDILLREQSVGFLSWHDRYLGRRPDLRGFTGLHCIAYMGVTQIAIALLEMKGWDLNRRDSGGTTPLIWATKYGNYTLVKLLLGQGDVDPTLADKRGQTPLAHAAKTGQEGLVKLLLERGDVNPDSPDGDGRTPLSYAAGSGHEGVVKLLLERRDVNPDSSTEYGRTPLSLAAESGHEGVVKLLLGRGDIDLNSSSSYGRTPLAHAVQFGHQGVVKLLLECGDTNPDSLDEDGRTPLSLAARSGYQVVAGLLLERGDVNPNFLDKDGRSPISYAAQSGHEGVVRLLLQRRGTNPDLWDRNHRTPLSYAAESGREGLVQLLLERLDVSPDSPTKYGRTPLSLATESGHTGVMKRLLERADVNPDSLDEDGRTPMSFAAGFGDEGAVKLLLQRGDVNPDLSDKYGWTPLSYATVCGHAGVARLLSQSKVLNHKISQDSSVTRQISLPSTSAQVELGPVSQRESIIPETRPEITEAIPLSYFNRFPLNQLESLSSAPVLTPIPTSGAAPGAATQHPGKGKRYRKSLPSRHFSRPRHLPSS